MWVFLGQVVSGYKVTKQRDGYEWKVLGKGDPQLPQMFYPMKDTSITLQKGDIVVSKTLQKNNKSSEERGKILSSVCI